MYTYRSKNVCACLFAFALLVFMTMACGGLEDIDTPPPSGGSSSSDAQQPRSRSGGSEAQQPGSGSSDSNTTRLSGGGLLGFGIAVGLAHGTHFLYNHQRFNADVWRNPHSAGHVSYDLTPRQRMLDDVIENVLPGSTQVEIEELLGASRNTNYFSESGCDLIYVLGPERGPGVDLEWLLVWFDDSGKFERYEIATD
jgi:hypothetical protein